MAAEADKGEGLRMLVQRAGGNVAQTMPKKLPAAGAQVRATTQLLVPLLSLHRDRNREAHIFSMVLNLYQLFS